jgi:HEAT repeat protein
VVFGLGQNFAAPFFTVYALQNLRLDYVWLQIFATMNSLAALASMTLWGTLTDKFGNKPLLAIGVVGTFVLPLLWIPTSANALTLTLTLLVINNLIGGIFWAGVGLTQFNLLIRLSPSEKTPVYVATMAAVTGLTGGLAPLVGSAVMHGLQGRTLPLFGFALSNFHITFAIAALLRLVGLLFLRPLTDASSVSARDVLQQLGSANPRAWRDMRQLRRGSDEESRRLAVSSLASSRTRLALTELIAALHDPSLAVREEAARALGEIGDPGAVESLLAVLRDPATGLADEAAYALGRIGDRRANPGLVGLLREQTDVFTPKDRMAAIQALGELGGPDAAGALLALLEAQRIGEAGSEEMTETLVRALGQIGDTQATPALVAHLEAAETPRPLRLALIRALGELGDHSALPILRDELAKSETDPVLFPLLADALARLEDSEALPLLLEGLCRLDSAIARKQAAHAIGTLLGEGEGVYGLLSLEEFARDAGVSRLIEEMQKGQRTTSLVARLSAALEAYSAEDYTACVQALEQSAAVLTPNKSAAALQEPSLRRRTLQLLAGRDAASLPVEAVLIALFALRSLVHRSS